MITFHSQVTATEGAACTLDCPACGARGVPSRPLESVDWVKIAYLIPILKLRRFASRVQELTEINRNKGIKKRGRSSFSPEAREFQRCAAALSLRVIARDTGG